ncbi:MAG: DNA polymerase III subunit delta [Candidatus Promineifilaceae bacterium]
MFYVFHGDDEYSQRETLAGLVARLGNPDMTALNTTRLDGGRTSLADLRHACDALPFLAEARLVICEGMFEKMPAKPLLKELEAYLPTLPGTTRLFFLESQPLAENHPIVKLAESAPNGYVKLFSALQGSALERWIRQRVSERGGQITPQAAQLLATNVGSDLRVLSQEIEKLTLYKMGRGEINGEDVTRLCPYVAEASIFELVDALGSRNGKRAAQLLQQKVNEGADPFFLYSMMVRQFRLLIQVKILAEQELRPPAIAKALKLHSFVAGKIHQQSQHFSRAQLQQIYAHLLDIDVGVKTGLTDMGTALDLFVAGIT